MEKNMQKKLNSKKIFTYEIALLLLLFLAFVIKCALPTTLLALNDDNFFQLAHGKYILAHGFPTTEPIRLHKGWDFMVTQWLFSVLLTLIYTHLGAKAVVLLYALPMICLNAFLFGKISSTISNKNANALLMSAILFVFQLMLYSYIRPYLFTLCFCFCETLLLENYIRKKDKKYLYFIPLLSILQINFHNSLWISLLLIQCCYYGQWIWMHFIKKKEWGISIKHLLITTLCTILAGCINPYGIAYVLYIFPSFVALRPFSNAIMELRSPLQTVPVVLIFYAIDAGVLYYAVLHKKNIEIRYICILLGFGLMFLMSLRNGIFFFSLGQLFLFDYLKTTKKEVLFSYPIARNMCIIFLCTLYAYVSFQPVLLHKDKERYKAIDWLYEQENKVPSQENVFTTFDTGSYAELKGYRVYLDTCAEIYGKAVNHKKDVAKESMDTIYSGNTKKMQKLLDSYHFKYCIVDTSGVAGMIQKCKNYKMIYGKYDKTAAKKTSASTGGWVFERIE